MNDFTRRLKNIMAEKKISQSQLSKISEISQSTLSDILNNKKSPTYDTIEKIIKSLGMSMATFFSESTYYPELAFQDQLILKKVESLSDEDKKLLEIIIDRMKKNQHTATKEEIS